MKKAEKSKNVTPLVHREMRFFSEEARRTVVKEIDETGLSKAEASRKYQVSPNSIYKWLAKYSKTYKAPLKMVVEHASEHNKVKKMEEELLQAYAALGYSKVEITYLTKIIEFANKEFGVDLKKNFETQLSSTLGSTKSNLK